MDSMVCPGIVDDRSLGRVVIPSGEIDDSDDAFASTPDSSAAHEHNATFPINSLPAEIFLDILFISIDFTTYDESFFLQLYDLAQVCSYWLHSIRSNPRFWRVINFEEPRWIDTVLKKNPDGPLAVRCIPGVRPSSHVTEFLQIARQHAHRWETFTLRATIGPEIVTLLDVQAPLLKYLNLSNDDYDNPFEVHLSAPALEHAIFYYIRLPINWASLSGLKYLVISSIVSALPSLVQLVTILQASPGLEQLELEEGWGADISDMVATKSSGLDGPVLLPALQVLRQRLLHYNVMIDAPNCRLFSGSILFDTLTRPGSTFVKIAKIPIRTNHRLKAYVRGAYSQLGIRFSDDGMESVDIIHIPDGVEPWRILMELLGIPAGGRTESFEVSLRDGPDIFSGEQIGIWSSASSMKFKPDYPHVLRALQFLATPTVVDGVATWSCPQLKSIRFSHGSARSSNYWRPGVSFNALVDTILHFLSKRLVLSSDVEGSISRDGVPMKVIAIDHRLFKRLKGRVPQGVVVNSDY